MMEVHAVHVDWATQRDRLRDIRERVFVAEQGVPKELEWDGRDDDAHHFVALNAAGQALGTARLLRDGQIGRMAVLANHRRHGIGRLLLDAAVAHATALGLPRVFLHAQRHAEEFYRKAGFQTFGAPFLEAGIEHVEMQMMLPIRFEPQSPRPAAAVIEQRAADHDRTGVIAAFQSESDAATALVRVLEGARRTLSIMSPTLDRALFAAPDCLSAVSAFARRSRNAHVRILLEDPKAIAADAHPLLELARRLPSKVAIRRLPDEGAPPRLSFVVADERSLWVQFDRDAYAGWSNPHDRVEARRLVERFDWLYERGSDDPELRLLTL